MKVLNLKTPQTMGYNPQKMKVVRVPLVLDTGLWWLEIYFVARYTVQMLAINDVGEGLVFRRNISISVDTSNEAHKLSK